jgi:glutathione S-transferase
VLLALAVKRVTFTSRPVRLSRGEQRRPDFVAVSPRGKVPALRDGAFTLYESLAILAYLDRRFPEPPLFGGTAEEAGLVQRLVSEHEAYLWPHLVAVVRPILTGSPGAFAAREEAIRASAAELAAEIGRMAAALGEQPYLAGARLTAADLVYYPSIQLALRAEARRALGLAPPANVAAWCARVEAIPGYDATYPPTWRGER